MTTAICFDLDGTLLRFDRPYETILAELFAAELGTDDDAVLEAYDETFFAAFEALEPDPVQQGMAAAAEAAGVDADADALAAALLDAECRAAVVDDAAREALAALGEDAPLGVITNGLPDWQAEKLAAVDLDDHFDAVVTSYAVGAHKPDPAPFEAARERLDADEYAMVGDDYGADVEGARAAGFVPVHYEHEDEGPDFWSTLRVMV